MKDDLQAIAFLFCSIALIMLTTLLFSAAAQWLSGVAYRLGLVSVALERILAGGPAALGKCNTTGRQKNDRHRANGFMYLHPMCIQRVAATRTGLLRPPRC
jgi:hypothetical protein